VMYALEIAGRRRGGRGLLGWFFAIPWNDPSVCAQVLAMIAFLLGGISGLMNASLDMNLMVHNTAFIPGHFHLTIGTAVALSYMGIAYWLVPYFEKKPLWRPRLALLQSFAYFVGVMFLSRGLMAGGLAGMPRRTNIAHASYYLPEWRIPGLMTAVGGSIMFASAMLFFLILVMTLVGAREATRGDIPFAATIQAPAASGWELNLDKLRWWVVFSVCLCVVVYAPFLIHHIPPMLTSPGLQYP
jgi:cytochrome c oxidase subunit I